MNQRQRLRAVIVAILLSAFFVTELIAAVTYAQRRRARAKSSAVRVEVLFRTNCARCHGADGRGDTPLGHTYNAPDFTDAQWWQEHSSITGTRTLQAIVSHGKGGMPAFGKKLSRGEIRLLINHVLRF